MNPFPCPALMVRKQTETNVFQTRTCSGGDFYSACTRFAKHRKIGRLRKLGLPTRALIATDTVNIAVPHQRIRRMTPRNWRNSVLPGLRTGNTLVAVVVPAFQCVRHAPGRRFRSRPRGRDQPRSAVENHHLDRRTLSQRSFHGLRLPLRRRFSPRPESTSTRVGRTMRGGISWCRPARRHWATVPSAPNDG